MKFFFLTLIFMFSHAFAAVTVSVNGSNHTIPQTNERGWGNAVTAWIQAISTYTLQPTGGNFTLTADANFGATYGLKSAYFSTRTANPSTAGTVRFANTESVGWRNAAASGNLLLSVNASDQLTYNGVVLSSSTGALLQDSTTTFYDNADATKLAKFELSGITTGTTRTFTLPDANTTLVGTGTTQTLTGKTLSGNIATNLVSGAATVTLPTATSSLATLALTETLTNKTLTAPVISTIVNTGTLTLPTSTDTLVGRATTDTLTNKSISGATNTLTAIPLTTAVTGVLPVANGGTNKSTWSTSSIPFAASTSALGEDNTNLTWDNSTSQLFAGAAAGNARANFNSVSGSYGGLYVNSTNAYSGTFLSQGTFATLNLTHAVNSAAYGASLNMNMSRGTTASRAQTLSGDRIGYVMANGFDNLGSFGTVGAGNIEFYAAGNVTSTSQPGEIRFSTTPASTITPKERLRLKSDGALEFAGATSGFAAIIPAATTTSYTMTLPSAQGGSGTTLRNDGAGALTWATAGSGSAGVNYITNSTADDNITSYAAYADAAGTSPVDGTAGAPSLTVTRTTSTPLRGTGSVLLTKDAVNRQGNGASYDFTIDVADKAKVLKIEFDYIVGSGTFVAGTTGSSGTDSDVTVWIYDVTNARLIQPSTHRLFSNSSTIADKYSAYFQTSSDSVSYRLIWHVASTSASAYTLKLDNVNVGPSTYVFGSPITDWQSYTPLTTWLSNTTASGFWRRVGDTMEVNAQVATSGAPTAAALTFAIPSGYTIDTAKIASTGVQQALGSGKINDSNSAVYQVALRYNSVTSVSVLNMGVAATYSDEPSVVTSTVPIAFGSADFVNVSFSAPITGWSSSVQMSDSADTRVVSFTGSQTSQAVTASVTNISFTSTKDSHAAWNGTQFLVPVPGDYAVGGSAVTNTSATTLVPYVNGVAHPGLFSTSGGAGTVSSGMVLVAGLKAGDLLSLRSNASVTLTSGSISIFRLSGPSAIAATETTSALYKGVPTGSIGATWNTITYPTKVKDSHGSYSSGIYTIGASGTYSISALLNISATFALNNGTGLGIYIDDVEAYAKFDYAGGAINGMAQSISVNSVPLLAGQTVRIKAYTQGTSPSYTSANQSQFSIVRTGNY